MSSRGVSRAGASPFCRFAERAFSASAIATSTLVGSAGAAIGDNENSVSSTSRAVSSRATAGVFSGKSSPCFARADTGGAAASGWSAGFGKEICAGSPGSRAVTTYRCASACSIRCKTRSARPRPISRSPPTAATTPGVTIAVSKVRSWIDTPVAANNIPATLNAPPNANKSKYIRLSLAPAARAKSPLQGSIVTALPEPRKDFYPMMAVQLGRADETRCSDWRAPQPLPKPLRRSYLEEPFAFSDGCTCA